MSTHRASFEGPGAAAPPAELLARARSAAWPWPLRFASWATAHRAGLVSIDDVALHVQLGPALALSPLLQSRVLIGFVSQPGNVAPVPLSGLTLSAVVTGGGGVLAFEPAAALIARTSDAGLERIELPEPVPYPPTESLGSVERTLLDAVTSATDVFSQLQFTRSDVTAASVLARMPDLLDEVPMPPGTSGRARLLRDRAAMLVVGTQLALAPHLAPATLQLDAVRRVTLETAHRAGLAALTAAANEQAYRLT